MGVRYTIGQLSGSSGKSGLSVKDTNLQLTGSLLVSGTNRIELGQDFHGTTDRQKNGGYVPNEIFVGDSYGDNASKILRNTQLTIRSQKLVLSGAQGSSGASSIAIDTLGSSTDRLVFTTNDLQIRGTAFGSNTGKFLKFDNSSTGIYSISARDNGASHNSNQIGLSFSSENSSSGKVGQIRFTSGSFSTMAMMVASSSADNSGLYLRNSSLSLLTADGSSQGFDEKAVMFHISGSRIGDSGNKVAQTILTALPPVDDFNNTKGASLVFAVVSGSAGTGRDHARGTELEHKVLTIDGGGNQPGGIKLHISGTVPLEFNSTSASIKSDGSNGLVVASAALDINASAGVAIDSTTLDLSASSNVTIDSSGGTIKIGADDVDQNITIGEDGVRTINVGTLAGSSSGAASTEVAVAAAVVDIDGGATGVTIDALDAGSIDIGTSTAGASDTSGINIGTNNAARAIAIGSASSTTTINGATLVAGANSTAITLGGASTTTTIPGNLVVQGDTIIEDSTTVRVSDKILLLASGSTTGNTSGGIAIASGSMKTDTALVFGSRGASGVLAGEAIVGEVDVQNGELTSLSTATPVGLAVSSLRLADGLNPTDPTRSLVISGTAPSGHGTLTFAQSTSTVQLNLQHASVTINQDISTTSDVQFGSIKSAKSAGGGTVIISGSNSSGVGGRLLLTDGTAQNALTLQAPVSSLESYSLIFPTTMGTAGQVLKLASVSANTGTFSFSADVAGGVTIGSDVTGGTALRPLFEDSSNDIAQSANFTLDADDPTVMRIGSSTTGSIQLGNDGTNALGDLAAVKLTSVDLSNNTVTLHQIDTANFAGGVFNVAIETGSGSPKNRLVAQLTVACAADGSSGQIGEIRAATNDTIFDEVSFQVEDGGGNTALLQVVGSAAASSALDSCVVSITRTLFGL